jgi:hypothetical protein
MGVAAGVMGGLALAQGVMGAFGASSQASAQYQAQQLAQQQANFRNQWAMAAEQRNQMRQFQANLERNALIERGANTDRAMAELYLDKNFLNAKGTLSKQTAQTNAQFLGTMQARGVGSTSGTARALMRQNMSAVTANMLALKTNYRQSYKDIENQQNQKLSQRQFSFQEQAVFLPTTGGISDTSSSALTTGLISAGLQGISAGYSANLQYGGGGGNSSKTLPSGFTGGVRGGL